MDSGKENRCSLTLIDKHLAHCRNGSYILELKRFKHQSSMIFELALAPKESLIKSKGLCQGKVKSPLEDEKQDASL